MKKTMLVAALLLAGCAPAIAEDHEKFCESYANLAESIMTSRQLGMSLSDLLAVTSDELSGITRPLIMDAYEKGQFSTETYKAKAIAEFRNKAHVTCLRTN